MTTHSGHCACGANRFTLSGQPLGRFICHCTVCQAYTGRAFSDVTVWLARDVTEKQTASTAFKSWKRPPNIQRGSCTQCGKPVIEFGIANQLAFVPTPNLDRTDDLPPAAMHLFHRSRVTDLPDALPRHEGFLASQMAVSGLLFKGLMARLKG